MTRWFIISLLISICLVSMVGILIILFRRGKERAWATASLIAWIGVVWISFIIGRLSWKVFFVGGVLSVFVGWLVRNKDLDWFKSLGRGIRKVFHACGCVGIGICVGVYVLIGTDVNRAWNVITENGTSTRWEDVLPINLKLPYPIAHKLLILEGLQFVDMAAYVGERVQSQDSGIVDRWNNSGLPSNYLLGEAVKKAVNNPNDTAILDTVAGYQQSIRTITTLAVVEWWAIFYVALVFLGRVMWGIRRCIAIRKWRKERWLI